jgi:hypothetical protein
MHTTRQLAVSHRCHATIFMEEAAVCWAFKTCNQSKRRRRQQRHGCEAAPVQGRGRSGPVARVLSS